MVALALIDTKVTSNSPAAAAGAAGGGLFLGGLALRLLELDFRVVRRFGVGFGSGLASTSGSSISCTSTGAADFDASSEEAVLLM